MLMICVFYATKSVKVAKYFTKQNVNIYTTYYPTTGKENSVTKHWKFKTVQYWRMTIISVVHVESCKKNAYSLHSWLLQMIKYDTSNNDTWTLKTYSLH